jgi:Arc/MetJ-type ribon-helix-helix transcriptional regulator
MTAGDTITRMSTAKIAISLDPKALRDIDRLVKSGRYPSRSKLVQDALFEKLQRIDHSRLATECAKLTLPEERVLANEALVADQPWPEY